MKNPDRTVRVAFLLNEQTWLSGVIVGAEAYSAVGRNWQPEYHTDYSRFEVSFLRLPGAEGRSFMGVSLPTQPLDDDRYDVVCIPPMYRLSLAELGAASKVMEWLRCQSAAGATMLGLVTGAFYLAEAGLLDEREATVHWMFSKLFQHRYPRVRLNPRLATSDAGNLWCTNGFNSSVNIVPRVIEKFMGAQAAQHTARFFMLQGEASLTETQTSSQDALVDAVMDRLQMDYQQPFKLEQLAVEFNISVRTLCRRFVQATELTPIQFLQRHRLQVARRLLESTSNSVEQIAHQCGFSSATVLGRAFGRRYGMPPLQYRKYMLAGESGAITI
ncbi:MAG: helix-turn-helix domain-containing protein [Pseudomonadota bacterium]